MSELAWLATGPCALLALIAIVLLGPPLGRVLPAATGVSQFWPHYLAGDVVRPEPTEHARYLLALAAPLLLIATTVVLAGRRVAFPAKASARSIAVTRVALVAFVAAAVFYQHHFTYGASYASAPFKTVYFTTATLIVSLAAAVLAAAGLRSAAFVDRLASVREARTTRICAFGVALAFTAGWLLSAFNTDGTIATVNGSLWANLSFWFDESFSILNGQAPLVDFHAQYGQLWAYIGAGAMKAFGTSFAVYATVMLTGTCAAMLAIYATLRRIVVSSLATLALFLPFLATSFFMEVGPLVDRYGPAQLFSVFPIRYAGPYVLLWVVVRRVGRGLARPPVLLFVFAGLVAINNVEFGVPALGASLVALVLADPSRSWARVLACCWHMLAGVVAAAVLVSLLTLAVAEALPHPGMLTTFPRLYGVDGFGLLPMPSFGLHLAVYLTFVAALVVAAVRVVQGVDDDAPLTAALAWAGVFGLGAGAYFVGRSHPHVLIDLFSAWALALVLLVVVAVRAVSRRPDRRSGIVELLVFAGFGIALCSVAQTPTPWSQVSRLEHGSPVFPEAAAVPGELRRAVAAMVRRGEAVALLMKEGHRIAVDLGLRDVTPYANVESMLTVPQWGETVQALKRAHGTKLILPSDRIEAEEVAWLGRMGYTPREQSNLGSMSLIEFRTGP